MTKLNTMRTCHTVNLAPKMMIFDTVSLTWMKVCQSTDWFWSWAALAEALCTGNLDHGRLDSAPHIFHTKHLLYSCTDHPEI